MSKENQKSEKCCFKDCDSLAEPMSNYCLEHNPSNQFYDETVLEVIDCPIPAEIADQIRDREIIVEITNISE